MERPFPISASPPTATLFSAVHATPHAPQPVHRSRSIAIAHLGFMRSPRPAPSHQVTDLPLPFGVRRARKGGGKLRFRKGDPRRLESIRLSRREKRDRVPPPPVRVLAVPSVSLPQRHRRDVRR